MSQIGFKSQVLNGKTLHFTTATKFRVQVAKGRKRGYKGSRYTTEGNLMQAVALYNSVNLGNGYKKRLVMELEDGRYKVLARQTS